MFTETCERRSTLMTPVPLALLIAFVGLLWGCTDPVEPVEEEAAAMIVFTINPPGEHEFEGRDVFVIRADGTEETRLTTGRGAFDASWSPDGTRIVFASAPEFGGDGHLYVMDANGSGVRAITSGPGSYSSPTWSPDGDRILFVRTGDPMSLNVVDADGSNPTTVVECPHTCRWPAWSPDGATVAVVLWAPITSPLHFSPVIYLVDLGDPEFRPLPGGFDYGHMPAWTPAGSLLLLGQRDGQAHAFYLATPGGQVLERIDLEGATGSSPSLLPDGRILYFELGTPSRIILLDRSTGEASVVREWADARTTFATPRFRP